MSIYIGDSVVPISIPETKVFVRHDACIVWPDGVQWQITHLQDVTPLFKNPTNDGKHAMLANRLLFNRVNARFDFRPVPTKPEQPPPAPRAWWRRMFKNP